MERKHASKKYSVIIGKLKGKDTTTEQAYRYDKKTWTASEARSHCKDHDGSFEPADDDSESSGDSSISKGLLAASVYSRTWAILPEALTGALQSNMLDFVVDVDAIEKLTAKRATRFGNISGDMAVLCLQGIITQRYGGLLSLFLGGSSTVEFAAAYDKAVNNPSIGAVLIDVDSPGGSVYGVSELSDKIYATRGTKPIIAVINSLCASAAYWIASAADEIIITPGGEVGSIGVMAIHTDISGAESQAGIKTSLIYAGRYKTEGNPHEPLPDEARAAIQLRVDDYYEMFIKAVARNRNTSASVVRNDFGQGRVLGATEAVDIKMVDRRASYDDVMRDLQANRRERTRNKRNMATLARLK